MAKRRIISTLDDSALILTSKRRDGNSCRLVDKAIQIILSGDICVVEDHHEMGRNVKANRDLLRKIYQRLENEHKYLILDKKILIDEAAQSLTQRNTTNIEIRIAP